MKLDALSSATVPVLEAFEKIVHFELGECK
jgi:hypothetical protein